jgi:AcrR family transcriptional regulator
VRILDAAEDLFIEHGFEAMSMRQITSRAAVNLAAVNYHFGKEALIHAMLSRRLDQLNQERLGILDRFDAQLGTHITCEHVLGAMFIPALKASRDPERGGPAFLRLIGRAYTDPSPFVRNFLTAHYASVAGRFFDAFQRALPHLRARNSAGGFTLRSARCPRARRRRDRKPDRRILATPHDERRADDRAAVVADRRRAEGADARQRAAGDLRGRARRCRRERSARDAVGGGRRRYGGSAFGRLNAARGADPAFHDSFDRGRWEYVAGRDQILWRKPMGFSPDEDSDAR